MEKLLKSLFLTLFVLTLSVGMTSCGDDDDDAPAGDVTFSIVGTWYEISDDATVTVVFNKDGKGTLKIDRTTGSGIYETFEYSFTTAADGTQKLNILSPDCILTGTWTVTITPTQLKMTGNGYYYLLTKKK